MAQRCSVEDFKALNLQPLYAPPFLHFPRKSKQTMPCHTWSRPSLLKFWNIQFRHISNGQSGGIRLPCFFLEATFPVNISELIAEVSAPCNREERLAAKVRRQVAKVRRPPVPPAVQIESTASPWAQHPPLVGSPATPSPTYTHVLIMLCCEAVAACKVERGVTRCGEM